MASHSSVPAWRVPWTEEPGGLQSLGSQRVRHGLTTKALPPGASQAAQESTCAGRRPECSPDWGRSRMLQSS